GRLQPDVGGDWRRRTDGIETLASLGEAGGSGPGAQQLANGIDLAMGHVQILRLPSGATMPRRLSCWRGGARLGNVLAPLDPSHQSFELLRRLGAEIGVVHAGQLLGDGK